MEQEQTSVILLVVVVVIAVLALGLALTSFATDESMSRMMGWGGGGMMSPPSSTTSAPGGLEWGVLALSAGVLVVAVILLVRARRIAGRTAVATDSEIRPAPATGSLAPALVPEPSVAAPEPAATAVPEPTLVKLLSEDERRMYLELRDHGGEMLQRDLVASGMFSKAKVTRVLDKLESKGIVVREAHGMTNRVRLVARTAR